MTQTILDVDRRYLLCRPRGGSNDLLVQLERCRRYCEIHCRVLLIDTLNSGLGHGLKEIFELGPDWGVETVMCSPDMVLALDAVQSVQPAELVGKISSYVVRWRSSHIDYVECTAGVPVTFDFGVDHPDTLLIHEQAGGGSIGLNALSKLVLTPQVGLEVTRRLTTLPDIYDAIHVRHSDYRSNYLGQLRRCRRMFRGCNLLVATDSYEVAEATKGIFAPQTHIFSVTELQDIGRTPLFMAKHKPRTSLSVDLLSDLLGLALCQRFVYFGLAARGNNGVKVSGYTILAYMLHNELGIVANLFSGLKSKALLLSRTVVAKHLHESLN